MFRFHSSSSASRVLKLQVNAIKPREGFPLSALLILEAEIKPSLHVAFAASRHDIKLQGLRMLLCAGELTLSRLYLGNVGIPSWKREDESSCARVRTRMTVPQLTSVASLVDRLVASCPCEPRLADVGHLLFCRVPPLWVAKWTGAG